MNEYFNRTTKIEEVYHITRQEILKSDQFLYLGSIIHHGDDWQGYWSKQCSMTVKVDRCLLLL